MRKTSIRLIRCRNEVFPFELFFSRKKLICANNFMTYQMRTHIHFYRIHKCGPTYTNFGTSIIQHYS